MVVLCLAQDEAADTLLSEDAFALLMGMLLDQQVPLERAFSAPYELTRRLGHGLDAAELADYDPEALAAVFGQRPALHRFPSAMARRVQDLCRLLVSRYDGRAERVWTEARTGEDLLARVAELPGFGEQKARIFVALLGKQLQVRPTGWRQAAGPFGEGGVYRSVADITDADSLLKVRAYKQQMKAAAKAGSAR
jgi:uncharacterized HhH-GPD family protein